MLREYLIYKVTNLINGKIYIGQTHFRNDDYLGSGIIISSAIAKYGKNNFKKEYIDNANTQTELDEKEKFWIKELNSQDKNIGYNIADGGWNDFTMNDEIKEKISNTLKGKYVGENAFRYGLKLSDEHKKAISIANKGKTLSDEHRNKISKANTGKSMPEHVKKIISDCHKGTKLSDEHKQKISESGKARNFHWSDEQIEKLRMSNIGNHQKHSKYVEVLNIETNAITVFNNIMQATRFLGIKRYNIKENFIIGMYKIIKIYK